MLTVTKIFKFCYGHSLSSDFGKCANLHGHNAELRVTFAKKSFDDFLYMVLDFNDIKSIVRPIVDKLDHEYLNHVFGDKDDYDPKYGPTCEYVLQHIVADIKLALTYSTHKDVQLVSARLYEGENSYAEWSLER